MRVPVMALAGAAAIVLVASALAAPAPGDPRKLILKQNAFPAGADYDNSSASVLSALLFMTKSGPVGSWDDMNHMLKVDAREAGYLGALFSDAKGELQVRGLVITTPKREDAQQAFPTVVKARQSFWKTMKANTTNPGFEAISGVPKYGDQQVAFAKKPTPVVDGSIDIVVRKGAVVWMVEVSISNRQPPPQMKELLADLDTYAKKQQKQINSG